MYELLQQQDRAESSCHRYYRYNFIGVIQLNGLFDFLITCVFCSVQNKSIFIWFLAGQFNAFYFHFDSTIVTIYHRINIETSWAPK